MCQPLPFSFWFPLIFRLLLFAIIYFPHILRIFILSYTFSRSFITVLKCWFHTSFLSLFPLPSTPSLLFMLQKSLRKCFCSGIFLMFSIKSSFRVLSILLLTSLLTNILLFLYFLFHLSLVPSLSHFSVTLFCGSFFCLRCLYYLTHPPSTPFLSITTLPIPDSFLCCPDHWTLNISHTSFTPAQSSIYALALSSIFSYTSPHHTTHILVPS